jgi:hypothetical protein
MRHVILNLKQDYSGINTTFSRFFKIVTSKFKKAFEPAGVNLSNHTIVGNGKPR